MKPTFKILILTAFLTISPFFMFAQQPPDPYGNPVTGNEVPPAGAPIGSGTFVLITLAAAYAARKIYAMQTEEEVA